MKKILIFFIFILSNLAHTNEITLGATQWCPYTCSKMPNKGIVSEFLTTLLEKRDIKLNIKFYPWKRAISLANNKKINGLLTGVKSEAPDLIFTSTPTISYRSCLFSLKANKEVNFTNFNKYRIGIISGYSYGQEFDQTVSKMKGNLMRLHGSDPLERLKLLLLDKKIDFFLEEEKVAKYKFKDTVVPSLCTVLSPVYMAFSNTPEHAKLIKSLNKDIINNIDLLNKIIIESLYK